MFIYAALGGAGFLLLLVMLIAGGFGEHDVPLHEASFDHGDVDGHAGPSPLSTRVIGAFLTLFGVGGIVGQYLRWDHPASSACGLVLGLAGATLVHRFALLLHSQEAGSELHMSELVAPSTGGDPRERGRRGVPHGRLRANRAARAEQ